MSNTDISYTVTFIYGAVSSYSHGFSQNVYILCLVAHKLYGIKN